MVMRRKYHLKFISSMCLVTLLFVQSAFTFPVNPQSETIKSNRVDLTEINLELFEGDIELPKWAKDKRWPYSMRDLKPTHKPDDVRRRRDVTEEGSTDSQIDDECSEHVPSDHKWPNATIYYEYHQFLDADYRSVYDEAMRLWENHTCINFVERTSNDFNYIYLVKDENLRCSSYVGMKGGMQKVSMSSGCFSLGHAIHELGHAIGFWHEHSRLGRDDYIDVIYDNIKAGEEKNFGELCPQVFSMVPDVGYDTESIMHYGPLAFSKDRDAGLETIRLKSTADLNYTKCTNLLFMGQRDQLSYLDIKRANKLYQCTFELREMEERKCDLPVTETAPTTIEPTATTLDITPTTTAEIPTRSVPKRLQSGSTIRLNFDNGAKGVMCEPSCRPVTCLSYGDDINTCNTLDSQFTIYSVDRPTSKKIKSGDTVALKSNARPNRWLDCNPNYCTVTQCTENNASHDSSDAVSNCSKHHYTLTSNRNFGKLINSRSRVGLKTSDSYMNCSDAKKCVLLNENVCKTCHKSFNLSIS